ncbi:MAG TPA: DUF5715 family protein [Longimicrobiales bacterium]
MRLEPVPAVLAALLLVACNQAVDTAAPDDDPDARPGVERVLDAALARMSLLTDSIDDLLQPVPLLRPAEESSLRRYGNAEHLARARALGARPADSTELAALRESGRLVVLEDSTPLWAVRELDYSLPLVTPDMHALLARIAEQFQERITALGLPRYRIEITSALRTPESQAELRRTNPNAAAGMSTHEYGTTVDIAYSSFAAPADPDLRVDVSQLTWLEPYVERIGSAFLETAAARKSRELQAMLGKVLLELQSAGDVYVTLERQQPVYHITVARRQTR